MNYPCPHCQRQIPLDDINVGTDVALCRSCRRASSFAELVAEGDDLPEVQVSSAAKGVRLREDGRDFEVSATTRSGSAVFLVPFTLLWSGGMLTMAYGTQIAERHFSLKDSLFGLPFLLATCFLVPTCLMMTLGRVTVRVKGRQGEIFTGVGPIGWRRRFSPGEVRKVQTGQASWLKNGQRVPQIWIETPAKTVKFASGVSPERQNFLLGVLRRQLRRR